MTNEERSKLVQGDTVICIDNSGKILGYPQHRETVDHLTLGKEYIVTSPYRGNLLAIENCDIGDACERCSNGRSSWRFSRFAVKGAPPTEEEMRTSIPFDQDLLSIISEVNFNVGDK